MNEATARAEIRPAVVTPGTINARLDRLPVTRSIWLFVVLLSLGGWFEFYDLFFTAYVGPGLVRSGLLVETTQAFLGFSGLGAFVAATFAGLCSSGHAAWDGWPTGSGAGESSRPRCSGTPRPRW